MNGRTVTWLQKRHVERLVVTIGDGGTGYKAVLMGGTGFADAYDL